MDFLIGYGLFIIIFILDWYIFIVSYMRKVFYKIIYFFDVWYLKKSEIVLIFLRLILNGFFSLFYFGFVLVIIIVIICVLMLFVVVN